MPRKLIDLSIFLENDVASDPLGLEPRIEYFTHENTFEQIAPFFPCLGIPADLITRSAEIRSLVPLIRSPGRSAATVWVGGQAVVWVSEVWIFIPFWRRMDGPRSARR